MTAKALKKEVNSAYCRYGHSLWRDGLILAARNMLKSNLKHSSVFLKLALITIIALHVGLLANSVAPNAYNILFYYDDLCVGSIDFGTFATWILNIRLV